LYRLKYRLTPDCHLLLNVAPIGCVAAFEIKGRPAPIAERLAITGIAPKGSEPNQRQPGTVPDDVGRHQRKPTAMLIARRGQSEFAGMITGDFSK
jgi:hypothetical protein